jgi:hypothetical protein
MLDSLIPDDAVVTVAVAQTSFAVVSTPHARFRIDFIDKAEACLKPGMRGNFKSYSEHPLLLSYNSPVVSVYINSKPQDPEKLDGEIRQRIEAQLQGWRNPSLILYTPTSKQNLLDGNGILLQIAPLPIAQSVIEACAEYSVSIWSTPPFRQPGQTSAFQLFLIGKGYVIAKDFRVVKLSTEKPQLPGQ